MPFTDVGGDAPLFASVLLLALACAGDGGTEPSDATLRGKIVFHSNRDDSTNASHLYVMNPDGSPVVRLTAITRYRDFEADVSPDGRRVAFVSERDGRAQIYVMNADGTGQARVTTNPGDDRGPRWSPDGARVVFSSSRDQGKWHIYVMNDDGADQTRLSDETETSDWDPAWSPDGSKITFTRGGNIVVMRAGGGGLVVLTTSGDAYTPAWSPDGQRIAYTGGGNYRLYVMDTNGANSKQLVSADATAYAPDWSPDGTRIAFEWDGYGIAVVNADGTGLVHATNGPGTDGHPSWSPQ